MSFFRKNLITNDWVIFAPNRAKRPRELKHKEDDNVEVLAERPEYKDDCPFCPGNEKSDDHEVLRLERDGRWAVRILENRFASVDRTVFPEKTSSGLRKQFEGFGIHDVIIDNPRHNATIALFRHEEVVDLFSTHRRRYIELQKNSLVKHVVLFKNQGLRAGGSLEHPHSQVYGLPVIPFETGVRLREAERYYELNDRCLLCDLLADEAHHGDGIIYENEHFVSLVPYAALSPFHFWIAPKHHSPSISLVTDGELEAFADCVRVVFGKVFRLHRNPDFNFVIQSRCRYEREHEYFHWYMSVIPHLKHKGGLEYAGGLYVNPVLPEIAAKELREA